MRTDALLATLHKFVNDKTLRAIVDAANIPEVTIQEFRDAIAPYLSSDILAKWSQSIDGTGDIEKLERELREKKITILTIRHKDYPQPLLDLRQPPPMLYVKGDLNVLKQPGIGICGSRKASQKGISYARRFGEKVARLKVPEVSGYAQGVDTEAHLGALDAGGYTIVVLAEGILRFKVKKMFEAIPQVHDRMVVVSEFPPTRPWRVSSAMKRNRTICALSLGMVVVEASSTGGTLDAGEECLRQNKPLIVIEYTDSEEMPEGNSWLIQNGGIPVRSGKELANQLVVIKQTGLAIRERAKAQQLHLGSFG